MSLAMMGSVCKFDRRQELGSPQTIWLSNWRGARRPCFTLPTPNKYYDLPVPSPTPSTALSFLPILTP